MKFLIFACVSIFGFTSLSEARPVEDRRPEHSNGPMIHPARPQPPTPDQEVYDALNVRERNPAPGRVGALVLVKSVGGLTCEKIRRAGPFGTKYDCKLAKKRDDRKIYDALNVTPVRSDRIYIDKVVDQKKIGSLTCELAFPSLRKAIPEAKCVLN